jgi:hypothetical protein
MFHSTLAMRVLTLASFAALAGCASLHPAGPEPEAAFVVVGENGAAVARVITSAASCPVITIDGQRHEMAVRVPLQAIPARPAASPQPPSSAVLTCEAAIPAGALQAEAAGTSLPLPRAAPRRIVVIGDTGCRVNKKETQDCNDPQAYPFARIAASAAAFKPDLVVHVGDFHYREQPCPTGRAGCTGSPWGYGWDAWKADFFAPGRALLKAAPWVTARGNHESCARAGQGYWRYLDPRPFVPGRDCDLPANDLVGDYSDPYTVPLGDAAQLIVFDSSNTNYKGLPATDPRRAIYGDMWGKIAALSKNARYNIAVNHQPLFAFGANRNAKTGEVTLYGGDAGLLDAFGDRDPGFLPKEISMLLSGHAHLWEQVSFSSGHPTQFVSGFSGTAEDLVPLPATLPPGATPARGAVVEHISSWIDGFGFMTMERTGAEQWVVKVWDRNGRERNSCQVSGRRSSCQVAQVK